MFYDYSEGAFFVAFYWFSAKYFWRTDVCVDSRVNQILRQSEMKFERERETVEREISTFCVWLKSEESKPRNNLPKKDSNES